MRKNKVSLFVLCMLCLSVLFLGSKASAAQTLPGNKGDHYTMVFYNGFENPNIHYQVGDGEWTAVPGIPMEANTEAGGYTHSYIINLGKEKECTVCFNDGNGKWDNNNYKNYTFKQGIYGVKDQKVENLGETQFKLQVTSFTSNVQPPLLCNQYAILNATSWGGYGPVEYRFTGVAEDGFRVYMHEFNSDPTAFFQPGRDSNYTLTVEVRDAFGNTDSAEMKDFRIFNRSTSEVTVYYRGLDFARIHYQIGDGNWTSLPGESMQFMPNLYYKKVIDLGSAPYANVCFNDGNGVWDSNNGQNYRLSAGHSTYYIENGQVRTTK